MKIKILITLFIIIVNHTILAETAKIKIVSSITPLAAIIAMLVKDQAEIIVIANNNACPHHYHLKPSDLKIVKDADIVFYIDQQFDGFVGKLMNSHSDNVFKISNFSGLNIIGDEFNNNWHIWLDLDNVIIMLEQLAVILAKQFPAIDMIVNQNLVLAKQQVADLRKIEREELSSLQDVILLSDSLEYFFNKNYKIAKLYNTNQKSLKYLSNLEELLNKSNSKCLILTIEQNVENYKKFNAMIVAVESENWQVSKITDQLFYNQYLKIINQVAKCLNY
jgi:zinc transport system substrate-binding protein